MSWKKALGDLAKYATGEALIGAAEHVKDTVDETVQRVIKASALFIIFVIGLTFFVVGLAKFLQAYNGWVDGTGFALIGAILIALGFFAKAMR